MYRNPTLRSPRAWRLCLLASAALGGCSGEGNGGSGLFGEAQAGSGAGPGNTANAPAAAGSGNLAAGGSASVGGSSPGTGASNDNLIPNGIDLTMNLGGGPSSGSGASGSVPTGSSGSGQNTGGAGSAANCEVPPPASTLLGWASVAGLGTNTTTGGGDAAPRLVTSLAELQAAVAGTQPSVIHVRGSLVAGDIEIGSNKTIVGLCGAELHGHLELSRSVNVIVRNLEIVGYGAGNCALDPDFDASVGCSSGADAISVQKDSHHIWFDHCSVRDGTDGNLDVTNGANFVTVSWTKFSYTPRTDDVGDDSTGASGHRYSNLVGGTDSPDDFDDENALNVTWHHNWWADNVVERQPRVRFGQNHLFNNYYDSETTNYCVRAGIQAQILLEGNFFDAVDDPHEFNDADDQLTAHITADASNTYLDTTSDRATGGGGTPFTTPPYAYTLDAASDVPLTVTSGAGPQ
jgi:pectate lyase